MQISLEHRTAVLGIGEFAGFALGPREAGGGAAGLWRAQLGQRWHQELRHQAERAHADSGNGGPAPQFEVPLEGRLEHRGWSVTLNGRIDQLAGPVVREVKTVTRALPAPDEVLRSEYPDYFLQAATYLLLLRSGAHPSAAPAALRAELVFVEADSGLAQTVALTPFDEALVRHQLDVLADFLEARLRGSHRRRSLVFTSPFTHLRPGQETIHADLGAALAAPSSVVLLEAPTGYGKTGCVLECALGLLRSGRFERLIWLTGKATGQLQVLATLEAMTGGGLPTRPGTPLAAWQVRPKSEHCINHTYHCLRDACTFLADAGERWPTSGLARFHLDERVPRGLEALRAAGRDAGICPYEITRTALAFQDVWLGDYNYVFAPANRGIFYDQPGFDPQETLLVIDEAHNLPGRVAEAHSHSVSSEALRAAFTALQFQRGLASLVLSWEQWVLFVSRLAPADALDPLQEADLRDCLDRLAPLVTNSSLDHAALGPQVSSALWQVPLLADWLGRPDLARLVWCPRAGELAFTCLDAAPIIGGTLRDFGGAVLMSATLSPSAAIVTACGLDQVSPGTGPAPAPLPDAARLGDLTKRDTRRLYRQLTSAAELLRVEEAGARAQPRFLRAVAPWREGAYDVAVDLRVDTTLRQRDRHYGTTAETVAALHAAGAGPVAVFFPSYAYAEAVARAITHLATPVRPVLQPRLPDLAAQQAWIEESLALADALFLVLGGSFAEGIDRLGGRVSRALVVSPALPEVNAVRRAQLAGLERAGAGRDAAFRRVYQVPGLQKVNQALGRLVRAPGQRARVLLHCRRFADPSYASLLAPEYQLGREIVATTDLTDWLGSPFASPHPT